MSTKKSKHISRVEKEIDHVEIKIGDLVYFKSDKELTNIEKWETANKFIPMNEPFLVCGFHSAGKSENSSFRDLGKPINRICLLVDGKIIRTLFDPQNAIKKVILSFEK